MTNKKEKLEEYYKDNFHRLSTIASRRVGHDHAQDVVQEAFLKAHKFLRSYKEGKDFEGWIVTIFNNALRDYIRTNLYKSEEALIEEITEEDVEFSPEEQLTILRLEEYLEEDDGEDSTVGYLKYVKDVSMRDISRLTGKSNRALYRSEDAIKERVRP